MENDLIGEVRNPTTRGVVSAGTEGNASPYFSVWKCNDPLWQFLL